MESIIATRRPRLAAEEQHRASKGVDLIGLASPFISHERPKWADLLDAHLTRGGQDRPRFRERGKRYRAEFLGGDMCIGRWPRPNELLVVGLCDVQFLPFPLCTPCLRSSAVNPAVPCIAQTRTTL